MRTEEGTNIHSRMVCFLKKNRFTDDLSEPGSKLETATAHLILQQSGCIYLDIFYQLYHEAEPQKCNPHLYSCTVVTVTDAPLSNNTQIIHIHIYIHICTHIYSYTYI